MASVENAILLCLGLCGDKLSFALAFSDFGIWFAVFSLITLTTSEILSPIFGKMNIGISKKRLRRLGIALGLVFVWVVVVKAGDILMGINLLL